MQLAGTEKSGPRHRRYPLTASTRGRGGGIVADVDHLDTASAYYTASYPLERASTRQLFTYPASTDVNVAIEPVSDLATELPTRANSGISADGKTYTVHLRPGAKWNTSPAREVTSEDVVLGLKRLCKPVSPVGPRQRARTPEQDPHRFLRSVPAASGCQRCRSKQGVHLRSGCAGDQLAGGSGDGAGVDAGPR